MIGLAKTGHWLLVVGVLISTDGWCDSYRCGRKVIHSGDTAARVLQLCGEPQRKDRGQERVVVDGARTRVNVQRWYYQQGRRSFEHAVLLYRGRVVGVEVGSR